MFGRRLAILLGILGLLAVPAGALRAACAARSCRSEPGPARVPFCPLPPALRADLAAGFREGRSPDVLAVTSGPSIRGGTGRDGGSPTWPSASRRPDTAVPIVFAGTGVDAAAAVPAGTGLDQIAPTLADVIGFRRPHPEVRAGEAVSGLADGLRPRLILEVAWKGIGTADLRAQSGTWPYLASLLRTGAGTLEGTTGSLPLDPAATLTTIGTGGPPSQHGITGTLVRNDRGDVVTAWGPGSPPSVIATLPDDLDEHAHQASLVGLVATETADRGIVGGTWYLGHDRDALAFATGDAAVARVSRMLGSGFGRDGVPDVLAVVLDGSVRSMDRRTRLIVRAARTASSGSVAIAVAGTGSTGAALGTGTAAAAGMTLGAGEPAVIEVPTADVVADVEAAVPGSRRVVAGVVPGGLFLDQDALASLGITGQVVAQALLDADAPDGSPLFADAFQGFAVSFARYC
ncbi:MAG: hypothetical protein ACE14W_00485 [Candidatus Velamenicoccus archaeovorus]